jgi:hypothetical protein
MADEPAAPNSLQEPLVATPVLVESGVQPVIHPGFSTSEDVVMAALMWRWRQLAVSDSVRRFIRAAGAHDASVSCRGHMRE